MRKHTLSRFGAVLVAMIASSVAQAREEEPAAQFFEGKTIQYIVSAEPGGGYDTYARMIARFLPKYIPVRRVLVRNVTGAGNIIGANTIWVARPDGLTIGTFNTGLLYGQLLELEGIQFNLREMSWIGKMAQEGRTMVLATNSGMDSIDDLMTAPETIRMASASLGTANHTELLILRRALGLNIRLIPGISGGEFELSMLRGEVAGVLSATSSRNFFVERGDGRHVMTVLEAEAAELGVPQARDLVRDPQYLPLLDLTEIVAELGRLTAGPPDIPADRLEMLRDAYMQVSQDPEFLAHAAQLEIPVQPARGDVVDRRIDAALNQPASTVTLLKEVIAETR